MLLSICFSTALKAQGDIPLTVVFNTALSTGTTVKLPMYGTVNVTVDWGDGNTQAFTTAGDKTHTYAVDGTYTVKVYGSLTIFGTPYLTPQYGPKLVRITDFGNIGLTTLFGTFAFAVNLVEIPATLPYTVTDLTKCFLASSTFNLPAICNWDVSHVTKMSELFHEASAFNQNISNWNVSNVTDMSYMFYKATSFNQNIGNWNVSKVTSMDYMFNNATSFNQNLGAWNISKVTNMYAMFTNAALSTANYDALLIAWAAKTVKPNVNFGGGNNVYSCMAYGARNILTTSPKNWTITDGGQVCPIMNVKQNTTIIPNGTGLFNFGSVNYAGSNAKTFTIENIGNYNLNITGTPKIVVSGANAADFFVNQIATAYSIAPSGTTSFIITFIPKAPGTRIATISIANNDFDRNPYTFTVIGTCENPMILEYYTALSAGNTITLPLVGTTNVFVDWGDATTSTYNTSGLKSHNYSVSGTYIVQIYGSLPGFGSTTITNPEKLVRVTDWGVTGLISLNAAFYNATNLIEVPAQLPTTVTNLSSAFYGATNFNGNITAWNVAAVTNMQNTFYNATAFNQNIGTWNVGNVTNMSGMFTNATAFNQNIANWNVVKVTNMSGMFSNATAFNQNLSNWNISKVTTMENMFLGGALSRTNYDAILTSWATKTLMPNVKFNAGTTNYTCGAPETSRAVLTSAPKSWIITDGGVACMEMNVKQNTTSIPTGTGTFRIENCEKGVSSGAITFTIQNIGVANLTLTGTPKIAISGTNASDFVLDQSATTSTIAPSGSTTFTLTCTPTSFGVRKAIISIANNDADKNPYTFTVLAGSPMTLVYNTNLDIGTNIFLPLAGTVNVSVDWGDGNTETFTTAGNKSHNYAAIGTYTVKIYGTMTAYGSSAINTNDAMKLHSVTDFGNLGLVSLENAFFNAYYLLQVPTKLPSTVTNLKQTFRNNYEIQQDLSTWDVSNVTNMYGTFRNSYYNGNISNWNTGNVTTMAYMFYGDTDFTQDIGNWDVSKVTDMSYMFMYAFSFRQDISRWNVSNVTNMSNMFFGGPNNFSCNVGAWNIGKVTNMTKMFTGTGMSTATYDAILTGWAAKTVKPNVNFNAGNNKYSCFSATARATLTGAPNNWIISDAGQVCQAINVKQNTTSIPNGTGSYHFSNIYFGNPSSTLTFTIQNTGTYPLNLTGTPKIAISGTNAADFTIDESATTSTIDASSSTTFTITCTPSDYGTRTATISIANSDATKNPYTFTVTGGSAMTLVYSVLAGNTISLPLAGTVNVSVDWGDGMSETFNTSGIRNHTYTSAGTFTVKITGTMTAYGSASISNQDKLVRVSDFGNIGLANLDYAFYNAINLIEAPSILPNSITSLSNTFNGATLFNYNISSWNVANVVNMSNLFYNCTNFNQNISGWNVANVSNMSNMFCNATSFNQNIRNWNVGNALDMSYMFASASTFNQNLANWNIGNASNMSNMFQNVTLSTEIYDSILVSWAGKAIISNVNFDGGNSKYSCGNAADARSILTVSKNWTITDGGMQCIPMVLEYNTALSTGNTIALPFNGQTNVTVNWGDGNSETFTTSGNKEHTYTLSGAYTVSISGSLWGFGNASVSADAAAKLVRVTDFGGLNLSSLNAAFAGASNLVEVPATLPKTVTDLAMTFTGCTNFNQNIGNWNVTNITNMSAMFSGCTNFNQNIGTWNVSKVTDMSLMFNNATAFNQNIGTWNVSNVTNMSSMFYGATAFNQNISTWNVANVTNMTSMFQLATAFNQNLSTWNIGKVTTMADMFTGVTLLQTNYNAILIGWSAKTVQPNVTFGAGNSKYSCGNPADARNKLTGAPNNWSITDGGVECIPMVLEYNTALNSNQSIGLPIWGTVNVTIDWGDGNTETARGNRYHSYAVSGIYTVKVYGTVSNFGHPMIGSEALVKVTDFGNLGLTKLDYAFIYASNLVEVPATLPSTVTSLVAMFGGASSFNQDISNWDVSNVINMQSMFHSCRTFNQNIGNWNVSNVTNMQAMFYGASAFNQNLGNWNITKVADVSQMFTGANLSYTNYDALLLGWSAQSVKPNLAFHAGNVQYSCGAAADARAVLTNTTNKWTISDAGMGCASISILQGNSHIPNGTSFDLINSGTHTFTIKNVGIANLDLTGSPKIVLSGVNASDFIINESATASSLAPSAITIFTVTFSPTATGLRTATISIANSSTGDNPYIVTLTGTASPMTLQFNTDLSTGTTVSLPLAGTVNVSVDWGDGNTESFTTAGEKTHTYGVAGIYTVNISGLLTGYGISALDNSKLVRVTNFGNIGLQNLDYAFQNAVNLVEVPLVLPITVTSLSNTFNGIAAFNTDVSAWGVSNVTNMSGLFAGCTNFNQNLSAWNISNVTDMTNMFQNVTLSPAKYDSLLISWATQTVKPNVNFNGGNSTYTCGAATTARAKLTATPNNWTITDGGLNCVDINIKQNTTAIPNNTGTFNVGYALSGNSVSAVTFTIENLGTTNLLLTGTPKITVSGANASDFAIDETATNATINPLSSTTFKVTFTPSAAGTRTATISIASNDVDENPYTFTVTGKGCIPMILEYNTTLSAGKTISIPFNGPTSVTVDWGDGNIQVVNTNGSKNYTYATHGTYTVKIYGNAQHYGQLIDNSKLIKVKDFGNLGIQSFNVAFMGAINLVEVPTVLPETVTDLSVMFFYATSFNQDISSWDVSRVTSMQQMFYYASNFNQNLAAWNISNVTYLNDIFSQTNLSTANYDAILISWATKNLKHNLDFGVGDTKYSCGAATDARAVLTGAPNNWTITDGGQGCPTMTITQNSNPVATGSAFDFGTNYVEKTFTIGNSGTGDLVLFGTPAIAISGANPEDFTISQSSTATSIEPSGTTTFTISFMPKGNGSRSATISIANGDMTKNPYTFTVTGTGESMILQYYLPSAASITLPLAGTVDVAVSWGDGTTETFTSAGNKTHTYTNAGTFTVNISGLLTAFGSENYANPEKLFKVFSWGNIGLTSLSYAFYDASNLTQVPTSIPATVTDLSGMFYGATSFNQDISAWNVSNVTNMRNMFHGATAFNQEINLWNVSNVTNMRGMFQGATSYNQALGNWNTISVTDMSYQFYGATAFHQWLDNWEVDNVTTMDYMFYGATAFNSNICNPVVSNTSNVTSMKSMFEGATSFNQFIGDWDVSKVTDFNSMFKNATSFNQNINNWNVGSVTNFNSMFENAIAFDQNLNNWNISNALEMYNIFSGVTLSVENYSALLTSWGAQSVNPNINFNGGNSQYTCGPAADARMVLRNDPNNWSISDNGQVCPDLFIRQDVTSTDIPNGSEYDFGDIPVNAFSGYYIFTIKNLGDYNANFTGTPIISVLGENADQFYVEQSGTLSSIAPNTETAFSMEFRPTGFGARTATISIATNQYDKNPYTFTVKGGAGVPMVLVYNTNFSAGTTITLPLHGSVYADVDWGDGNVENFNSEGNFEHTYSTSGIYTVKIFGNVPHYGSKTISNDKLWKVLSFGGLSTTDYTAAFYNATNLVEVSTTLPPFVWDLSYMFAGATSFNQDINGWFVDYVGYMTSMFEGATNFNQNLNFWYVANLLDMSAMFKNATSFNGNVSNWPVRLVTNMSEAFSGAESFSQDIGNWDVSAVTDMSEMFKNTISFNQPLSSWDVSNVTNMSGMFQNAVSFNQNIGNWNVGNVLNMNNMFENSILSTDNYDALLSGWSAQTLKPNVNFNAGNSRYSCSVASLRNILTSAPNNWIIADGGTLCAEINVKQNTTQITSGTGSYDFGNINLGSNSGAITFTIENLGNYQLNLTGTPKITISGTNASDFSIDETTTNSIIDAFGSTSFTITFAPTFAGVRTATISIANSDVAHNPYTLAISGNAINNTTIWNGTAWDNGTPDATKDAIIAANYSERTNVVCNNLTINSPAVLTIYPNVSVTVNGTLTNNNGTAGLVIKSDATGTGSLIHTTTLVPATVERYALQNRTLYFSSAITNAKSNTFAGAIGLYKFNAAAGTPAWAAVTIDATNVLTPGIGFAVKYTTNLPDIKFIGSLNTGEVSPVISHNNIGYNWNLVGNPYPSAADWDATGWTKTGINDAIYLRTGASTVATYSGGVGTNGGSRYIATSQGFWVRTTAASPVLTFTNSVRVHSTGNTLKGGNANILRLNIDAENYSDEIAIALNDNASNEIDAMDAHKMFSNGNSPELYSLVDNKEMVINQLSASNMPSQVNLGVKSSSIGTYTLRVNLSEFGSYSGAITLVDNLMSKRIDLRTNTSYTFTSAVGSVNNRFAIDFTNSVTGITEAKAFKTQIFATQDLIHVRFSTSTSAQVDVVDMLGRILISKKVNDADNIVPSNGLSGIYLVRVKTEKGSITEKVFLQE